MKKTRKKFFSAFVLIFIFITAAGSFAAEYTDGDVIVVFKPEEQAEGQVTLSSVSLAEDFASLAGAELKETYEELSNSDNGVFALIHSDNTDAEEFAEKLKENPNVLAASPNYKFELADYLPNDASFNKTSCWGSFYVNAPEAWDTNTGSKNVYVAMIDSGVDYTNPDISPNYNSYYSSQFSPNKDTNGHGTHVAGIIGAKGNNGIGIAGMNWDVGLIAVNALPSGNGSTSDITRGINFVIGLIKNGVNIRVVNLSLQANYNMKPTYENFKSDPLWLSLKALDDLNKAVIVAAAGNYGGTVGEYIPSAKGYVYPASFKYLNNMITVSSLNSNSQLAATSSKGADIAAPGVNILSTIVQNSNSSTPTLGTKSGTSMAAAFVSGAAALLASINSNLTAFQIRKILVEGNTAAVSSSSSVDRIFNISKSIEYYEENKNAILAAAPSEPEIEDDNESSTPSNSGSGSSGGGGGGCNGLMLGIFAALIFVPLAKKLKR